MACERLKKGGSAELGHGGYVSCKNGRIWCFVGDCRFFFVLNNGFASNRGRSGVGVRHAYKKNVLDTNFYVILLISLSDVVKTGVFPWAVCCRKMSQFVVQCYCWSAIPETSYDIWPPPHLLATDIWHGCWRQISEVTVGGRQTDFERWSGAGRRGQKVTRDTRRARQDEFFEVILMFCAKLHCSIKPADCTRVLRKGRKMLHKLPFSFISQFTVLTSRTPCFVWQLSLFSCGICRGYTTVQANRTTHTHIMNCAIKESLQRARPQPHPAYRVGLFAISSAPWIFLMRYSESTPWRHKEFGGTDPPLQLRQ